MRTAGGSLAALPSATMPAMFRNTAHVYDAIYGALKDYPGEAAALTSQIRERNPGAQSLLDIACGTGLHMEHLRDSHGFSVTGCDIDPQMVEIARRRLGPGVEVSVTDMRLLDLGTTFDAVTCLFSAIGYMPTAADLTIAVVAAARHVSPGGVLVIDGWVKPTEWRDGTTVHVDEGEGDGRQVIRMGRSIRDGVVTRLEMHYLIGSDEGIEHVVDHHDLTLFSDSEYTAAFAAAGIEPTVVASPMPGRDRYLGVRTA